MDLPNVIIVGSEWYGATKKTGIHKSGQISQEYENMENPGIRLWVTQDRTIRDENDTVVGDLKTGAHH